MVCLLFVSPVLLAWSPPASAAVGDSTWRQLANDSVKIYFDGLPSHTIVLHWSVVDRPGHWLNTTDSPMVFDSESANYSVTIGPFDASTSLEWVFHDLTTDSWYNLGGKAYSNWSFTISSQAPTSKPLEMTVFTDKYTYRVTDILGVTVQLRSIVPERTSGITVNSSVFDTNNSAVLRLPTLTNESVGPLSTEELNLSSSLALPDANYVVVATAVVNDTVIARSSVPLVVLDTVGRPPLTLALVFHMHQPIYLNLQGQFEQPWVQLHSGGDFVYNGSWYGAYLWHVVMLKAHPGINVTFNLQPSLLYQWNASMHGFQYNGTYPGGQQAIDRDLVAVNETVQGYRTLASEGRIEILTSPFYHPLSAILVQLGLSSDLEAQINLGRNYTEKFMGVSPQGMWTPEMGFTMAMVPIVQDSGLSYTILDENNQFLHASGPSSSASVYQPFLLQGANGSHIVVFFRDTTISNDLFNTWLNEPNPRVAASDFIAAAANVYRAAKGGVLTVALDGENPIIQGSEVLSALDLDSIYSAVASQTWLRTSTLGQILSHRSVTAQLTSVPDGSWSGGFGLWIGSLPKDSIWKAILEARSTLVNLTKQYGSNDPRIVKLWNYLYIAEGSDWEWQTPGPVWFAMQGYRYADAAMTLPVRATATTSQTTGTATARSTALVLSTIAVAAATVVILSLLVMRRRRKR
jgi:hypothetical protein